MKAEYVCNNKLQKTVRVVTEDSGLVLVMYEDGREIYFDGYDEAVDMLRLDGYNDWLED